MRINEEVSLVKAGDAHKQNVEHALDHAKRGGAVFPLWEAKRQGECACPAKINCQNSGKHPRTMNGFKDATTDEGKIKKWWDIWPDANIGIATGAAVGLFALDVDPRNDGHTRLGLLEEEYGALPETLTAWTGGDGWH